jgi:hypothetical protein
MARMIPGEVRNDLSGGEARVFQELKDAPSSRDWIVFHSLALSSAYTGRYGEIDFVILIPDKGIVCVEVKGGGISCSDGNWTTVNRHGVVETLKRSPFEQARDGMWKLLGFLKSRFGLGSPEARCPLGWIVIFPDAACPPRSPDFARGEVIDRAQLSAVTRLIDGCPSLVEEMGRPTRTRPTRRTLERLAEALRPDFECPASDANLIWLAERRIEELTGEQAAATKGLSQNKRILIEGAAGTGKTIMALNAAREFSAEGRRVVLTCFNRNLGSWLSGVSHTFGPGAVLCGNLHRLLRERIMRSSGADLLAGRLDTPDTAFGPEFFDLGAMAIAESGESFDAIIVDEAQDFQPHTLADIINAWGGERQDCRIMVSGDFARQAIYQSGMRDASSLLEMMPGFTIFQLTLNCRNTRRIARMVDMTVGPTGARVSDRQIDGAAVDLITFKDTRSQLDRLDAVLRALQAAGCSAEQIVILGPRRIENSVLAGIDQLGGLRLRPFEEYDSRAASYATIHSFKGLERPAVILVDVTEAMGESSDALLYVGMSRARSRLFILISETSKSWFDEMQAKRLSEAVGS